MREKVQLAPHISNSLRASRIDTSPCARLKRKVIIHNRRNKRSSKNTIFFLYRPSTRHLSKQDICSSYLYSSFSLSALLTISSACKRISPNDSFSRIVPLGKPSMRNSSCQCSGERTSPFTYFNRGSMAWV